MRSIIALFLILCLVFLVSCNQSYEQTQTAVQTPIEEEVVEEEEVIETAPEEVIKEEKPVEHLIRIEPIGFDPRTIVINSGETIIFNNSDFDSGGVHIIVGWEEGNKANQFKSGRLAYKDSFEVVLDIPGTYKFLDAGLEEDDERELFSGTIIVK